MQAIQLRNRSKCHTNRIREQVQTSDFPSTKEGFHLGPYLFNGIQIGTVGRKVQYVHSLSLQNLPDGLYMMSAQIIIFFLHHNQLEKISIGAELLYQ